MEKGVDDGMVGALSLGDGTGEGDAALVEHDQVTVEAFDAEQFVGDNNDSGVQFAVEGQEQFVDLGGGYGVEAGAGLVAGPPARRSCARRRSARAA